MHWLAALLRPRYFQRLGPAAQSESGTARSRPSSCRLEPISPSVWSSVRRNTVQRQGGRDRQGRVPRWPPWPVRASARQPSTACSESHIVRLLRERSPASYSAQLVNRCRCLGMRCRRSEFALKGMVGAPHGSRARPPTRILDHAQPGGLCNKVPLHRKHRPLRHAVAVVTIRR